MESSNKITHFVTHYNPCLGGLEAVAESFAKNTKHKITDVVCLNKCSRSKTILENSEEEIDGIKVYRKGFLDLGMYKLAPGIIKHMFSKKILHIHGVGFFLDIAVLLKPFHRNKIALSTHGGIFHTNSNSIIKKLYFHIWARFVLIFADKIIASSQNDAVTFKKIANNRKIITLENPVNTNTNSNLPEKKENQFVFIGRLSSNKRVQDLFKPIASLASKDFFPVLKIGGGDFDGILHDLKLEAKKYPKLKIEFLGRISNTELTNLYKEARFFVSASQYEGFGVSAIEAMSYGCISILNSIPSFKRFIDESKAGYITDYSAANLASVTFQEANSLNKEERKELSRKAFDYSQHFSPVKTGKKLEEIYSKMERKI